MQRRRQLQLKNVWHKWCGYVLSYFCKNNSRHIFDPLNSCILSSQYISDLDMFLRRKRILYIFDRLNSFFFASKAAVAAPAKGTPTILPSRVHCCGLFHYWVRLLLYLAPAKGKKPVWAATSTSALPVATPVTNLSSSTLSSSLSFSSVASSSASSSPPATFAPTPSSFSSQLPPALSGA